MAAVATGDSGAPFSAGDPSAAALAATSTPAPAPLAPPAKKPFPQWRCLVLGDKGSIYHGTHGATGVRIFPEEKMLAYKRPDPTLPRVKGHHADWLDAIRQGTKAGSHFDCGCPLTEIALLGIAKKSMANRLW